MVWGRDRHYRRFLRKNHDPHLIILIYNCCIGFFSLTTFFAALWWYQVLQGWCGETGKWLTAAYGLSAGVVVLIAYSSDEQLYFQCSIFRAREVFADQKYDIRFLAFLFFSAVLLLLMIYHRKTPVPPFMRWYILSHCFNCGRVILASFSEEGSCWSC